MFRLRTNYIEKWKKWVYIPEKVIAPLSFLNSSFGKSFECTYDSIWNDVSVWHVPLFQYIHTYYIRRIFGGPELFGLGQQNFSTKKMYKHKILWRYTPFLTKTNHRFLNASKGKEFQIIHTLEKIYREKISLVAILLHRRQWLLQFLDVLSFGLGPHFLTTQIFVSLPIRHHPIHQKK